jgi:hypothetical protein
MQIWFFYFKTSVNEIVIFFHDFKQWVIFGHIGDLIEDEPGIGVVAAA